MRMLWRRTNRDVTLLAHDSENLYAYVLELIERGDEDQWFSQLNALQWRTDQLKEEMRRLWGVMRHLDDIKHEYGSQSLFFRLKYSLAYMTPVRAWKNQLDDACRCISAVEKSVTFPSGEKSAPEQNPVPEPVAE